eukprot:13846100-Heterocapsa_arctica.AAC.1
MHSIRLANPGAESAAKGPRPFESMFYSLRSTISYGYQIGQHLLKPLLPPIFLAPGFSGLNVVHSSDNTY